MGRKWGQIRDEQLGADVNEGESLAQEDLQGSGKKRLNVVWRRSGEVVQVQQL